MTTAVRDLSCPTGCGRTRAAFPIYVMCHACWEKLPNYVQRAVTRARQRFQKTHLNADLEEYLAAKDAAIEIARTPKENTQP